MTIRLHRGDEDVSGERDRGIVRAIESGMGRIEAAGLTVTDGVRPTRRSRVTRVAPSRGSSATGRSSHPPGSGSTVHCPSSGSHRCAESTAFGSVIGGIINTLLSSGRQALTLVLSGRADAVAVGGGDR